VVRRARGGGLRGAVSAWRRIGGRFAGPLAAAVLVAQIGEPAASAAVRPVGQAAIGLRDLRAGAVVRWVEPTANRADGPFRVVDLELKENGALAWTVARGSWTDPQFSARELWVSDAQGQRVLDGGPGLETQSLTLSGSTLTWVNEGQTRSATLG
jgi:hypothetical protein